MGRGEYAFGVTLHSHSAESSAALHGVSWAPGLPMVSSDLARPPVERQGSRVNMIKVLPASALSLAFTREGAAIDRTGGKQSLWLGLMMATRYWCCIG